MTNLWVKFKRIFKIVANIVAIILLVAALLSLPYIYKRLQAHDKQSATISHIDKKTDEILRKDVDLQVLQKRLDELERKVSEAGRLMTSK